MSVDNDRTDMTNAFSLRDVRFGYSDAGEVLAGIGFDVPCGQSLAILGANGSGKSTLLAMLDGLLFPSEGEVTVLGQPLTERALRDPAFNAAFRSRVGFVFQEPDAQLFSATVHDEVAFGPLQLGLDEDAVRERVDALLSELQLGRLSDRAPFLLSGGEKRRVAIASVLAVGPSVLLLDEPTNGLDPRTQVWLLELIAALTAEGRTVVMATHDLGFAEEATDRCVVLAEDHRLVADGPTGEIIRDHELLLACNLIHEHAHRHGDSAHAHAHAHGPGHAHPAHAHDHEEA